MPPLRARYGRTTAAAAAAALAAGLLAVLPAESLAAPRQYTLVVAPTGAPRAGDDGPGTAGQPLQTLAEAQRRPRDLVGRGDGDVRVSLLKGIHRLASPLRFGAADSGRDGHTVTWTAAPGAAAAVSGAEPVTGWELDDPATGIYKADAGTGFDSRQLYVDGVFEGLTFTGTTWLHPGTANGYANQQTGAFISGVQPHRPSDAFTSCAVGCSGFEGARNNWAQAPGAVQVSAAQDIGFENNGFVNLGSVGLGIGNDANAHGTGVAGGIRPDARHPSDPRMTNGDILIRNNRIYSTALEYLDQDAIFAGHISGLAIEHDYVSHMPYTGIGIGYGWVQPIYQTPTTLSDVRVVGNHVRNVVRTMFDAGCIYSLSAIPNGVVDENYCENSGQLGLYFDEGSRHLSGSRNVFVGSAGQWAHANNQNGNHTGDPTLVGNYTTNPAITGIVDGQRGNVARDNVTFSADDIPDGAREVISNAGPAADRAAPAGRTR